MDEIGRRLLASVGALGESVVKHEGQTWEWTFVARDPQSFGAASEPSEGVSRSAGNMSNLRVVLMAGRFESAQGFSLSNDGRIATFDEKLRRKSAGTADGHDQIAVEELVRSRRALARRGS